MWDDVVGYEEGCERVKAALACGYPRFVYHPHVEKLCASLLSRHLKKRPSVKPGSLQCAVAPNFLSALRLRDFLLEGTRFQDDDVYVYSDDLVNHRLQMHVHGVMYPSELAQKAKAFWQHTGEVVSSRQAHAAAAQLAENTATITPPFCAEHRVHCAVASGVTDDAGGAGPANAFEGLRESIAGFTGAHKADVHFTPSGMGAVSFALRVAQEAFERRVKAAEKAGERVPPSKQVPQAVVFGFPYLDTLKLCERPELCPGGSSFFKFGHEQDLRELEALLKRAADPSDPTSPVCAVFTEFPSNPLLRSPDLHRLKSLLQEHDVPLVVDDTIANFANVDLFGVEKGADFLGADIIVTSLTKLFSGRGDAMGGSMVINPKSRLHKDLSFAADVDRMSNLRLEEGCWEGLYPSDAAALYLNSRDFEARSQRINETALDLVQHIADTGFFKSLYYPALTITEDGDHRSIDPLYARYMKASGGAGSLFSVVFDEEKLCPKTFYDCLAYSKGPSLGTNFTLCCPYTILAHYTELDWAEECGVARSLIRVSVGLEEPDFLKQAWTTAVEAARR